MASYNLKVDPDAREITVSMSVMDIYAGLRQSARIAREEHFPNVAARCDEYADMLDTARAFQGGTFDDEKGFYAIVIRCD